MRVLRRDPDDRFDSAADLRAALLDTGVAPAAHRVPASTPHEVDLDEPTEEHESFGRSERKWLLPALFIALVASALTVAGLLLHGTTVQDEPEGSDGTTSSAPAAAGELALRDAVAHDPVGGDGENDTDAPKAVDRDESTAWRTESYDAPTFFGAKTGVGLGALLEGRSRVDRIRLSGSTTGWSGELFVLDTDSLDGVDPDALTPVATVTDVRDAVEVDLTDADHEDRTGRIVLVWITDLGDPGSGTGGRHRVELAEVRADGVRVDGG